MSRTVLIGLVVLVIVILVAVFAFGNKSTNTSTTATATPTPTSSASTGVSTSSTPATNLTVTYNGSSFSPATLTIQKGQTVTFVNNSSEPMWVASDPHPTHINYPQFDAKKDYNQGQSYTFTFDRAGSWGYHNHDHTSVKGTIVVQ